MYQVLNGKEPAEGIIQNLRNIVTAMEKKPHLVIVLVGNDPASEIYVKRKVEMSGSVGVRVTVKRLPEEADEKELLDLVEALNKERDVDGFIVQSPIPKHMDYARVVEAIDPKKDVDGWTSTNIGRMFLGLADTFMPATPMGIMRMLDFYNVPIAGKNATVIGRGNVVGKPMAFMLLAKDATVTICHSKTPDLAEHTRNADIIIAAAGVPGLVKADMVKQGAYVVDVGTTRVAGKTVGDVDFVNVIKKAHCSPVPGGVGPMTVAVLLSNVIEAVLRKRKTHKAG